MIQASLKKIDKGKNIRVPEYLIREEIEGQPYFYPDYKAVLNNQKILEEVMGASTLQSLIVEILNRFLILHLERKKYRIFTSEVGGHLEKGTNLSFDIAVFDRKTLPISKIDNHYADVPPKMVFEIDVKIDLTDQDDFDYINSKTEKLLEYGTELIVWVLTKQQKLLVARPNTEWTIIKWDRGIQLIEDIPLNVADLIKEEEELG